VPPILIAILLVTVFVVDADTAVETSALPVTAGSVIVFEPAVAGAATVIVPLVSPEIMTDDIMFP